MNDFMNIAIEEAKTAYNEGNVPVGAVIVRNGEIISRDHNRKNSENVSIYHAELLCIVDACKKLESWYLDECVMCVTLKPCEMCSAAIGESRIKNVYYLLDSNYSKNLNTNISNIEYEKVSDCYNYNELLSDFFKMVRE